MREFKFRAWNKKSNYMDTEFSIHADGCVYQNARKRWDISDIAIETAYDELEVMAFTGYKDYKGKDIYEGDIISAPNGQIKKAVIYFSQATFWYKEWDEMYEEWHHSEMGWCEQYGSKEIGILHWSANRIALEVIGNVHEHPELMTDRHEA
jgi:uncharacterized phage protein (TIGR01671 family)